MPVNPFDNYPMSWTPVKEKITYPYYISLAEQLEHAIRTEILPENTMLPPQRELADFLDLSLSTITKAYKLCEVRGLVYGKVGRGTFVASGISGKIIIPDNSTSMIQMGDALPFYEHNNKVLQVTEQIVQDKNASKLFEYANPFGSLKQQEYARKWLLRFGIEAKKENVGITSGSQNALVIALMALFKPGDKIVTDTFTYPNFISLAHTLNIQLIALRNDKHGIIPSELDSICRNNKINGIYLMPSVANPTNILMNIERRKEISNLIKNYGLTLIEDDAYAFLSEETITPMTMLVPEQSIYINGISKAISAGLRIAYIRFPERYRTAIENAMYNINLKTPALNLEIATEIMRLGVSEELIQQKKQAAEERNKLFSVYFKDITGFIRMFSHFQWIPLPHGCSGKLFEFMCKERGVCVYGSERFAAGDSYGISAVRLATSSTESLSELDKGLAIVRDVYDSVRLTSSSEFIL